MKFYQPEQKALVFIKKSATANFWDGLWKSRGDARAAIAKMGGNSLVTQITQRYLKPGDGPILEGGCGRAHYVYALTGLGYDCTGLDYAKETVEDLQQSFPELKVVQGDVREMPFPDGSFVGYWSLGVIEHFWDGYEPIAREAARVLRSGGYLFLTFPQMSWLRRLRVKLGFYPVWKERARQPEDFYQFALNVPQTVATFGRFGFSVIEQRQKDGLKGAKDELVALRSLLQWLYDYKGTNFLVRVLRKASELFFTPIAGHTTLIVFKKA